jgi:hypothetical protein
MTEHVSVGVPLEEGPFGIEHYSDQKHQNQSRKSSKQWGSQPIPLLVRASLSFLFSFHSDFSSPMAA